MRKDSKISIVLAVSISRATRTLKHWLRLSPDAKHVEGVGAVGACLELILFGLGELLSTLVLLAVVDSGRGDRNEQVGIVVTVDEYLQSCSSAKPIVDESILLDVSHRVAEISLAHRPAHRAQRAHHLFVRVVVVESPVCAHHGRIVVEDNLPSAMEVVVGIEILKEFGNLALILDEERF